MADDLGLRRKWTFKAHGRQVVLVKHRLERAEHVLMKALLWALYLPRYPELRVEVGVGDRFKPDLVALDAAGQPRFWGEAGEVGVAKLRAVTRRYRDTHLAIAKWDASLAPLQALVSEARTRSQHRAPFDLLCFPADSAARFIAPDGALHISHDDLEWLRL